MTVSVRNSVSKLVSFLLLTFACFNFNVSNAQCPPGNIVSGSGVVFVPIGGGPGPNGNCFYISTTGGDLGTGFFRGSQIAGAVAGTGGYAASIHTLAENQFIANAVLAFNGMVKAPAQVWRHPSNAWIGFTDLASETNFIWSSGEPECFKNWNIGEPNDFAIGEDFTQILIMDDYSGTNFGKWNDWFNDVEPCCGTTRLRIVLEVGRLETCQPIGNEGCSHGFWKNHEEDWQGYTPGQTLESVFDVPVLGGVNFDNFTLMQALNFGGGSGVAGGARNLFKQAVGALLNAAHADVDYPLTTAQVIAQTNAALATQNRDAMLALAGTLDDYNNLHNSSLCGDDDPAISRQGGLAVGSVEKEFAISGYPNPSRANFNVQINGISTEKVSIRVTDMTGRLVEQRTNLAANQVVALGNNYGAGMYYIEVTQGGNKKQLKVVKQ